ncbi:MAG: hypothetical protein PHF00_07115 [Elusimicrobia bacterium]|nr:hypothetical protein [Elusimicrobiota bacterium]
MAVQIAAGFIRPGRLGRFGGALGRLCLRGGGRGRGPRGFLHAALAVDWAAAAGRAGRGGCAAEAEAGPLPRARSSNVDRSATMASISMAVKARAAALGPSLYERISLKSFQAAVSSAFWEYSLTQPPLGSSTVMRPEAAWTSSYTISGEGSMSSRPVTTALAPLAGSARKERWKLALSTRSTLRRPERVRGMG